MIFITRDFKGDPIPIRQLFDFNIDDFNIELPEVPLSKRFQIFAAQLSP